MQQLFTMDRGNYTPDQPLVERFGIRGLIRRGDLWAMQHGKYGEYKIPGGGKDPGETDEQTLIREVREETGLLVIPESIRPIGEVLELRRDQFDATKRYIAHSRYYFCTVQDKTVPTELTPSEVARGYEPVWADLDTIIRANEKCRHENWLERDTRFLKWLRQHPELF